MGRRKPFLKKNSTRIGRFLSHERVLDAESLRDTVGTALYNRIMQWNDSGAAEALQAAEQRRKAKEIKRPCWVPKLKNDLYIASVDWDVKESGDVCEVPKSAVALAKKSHVDEPCKKARLSFVGASMPSGESPSYVDADLAQVERVQAPCDVWGDSGAVLLSSVDVPFMVDAVLEHGVDGPRLLVGGCPVEPSGWDDGSDQGLEKEPCLVEAVLEDYEDGQRLLVGGWPVQPSWDELDMNWSQLGWRMHKPSKYGERLWEDQFLQQTPPYYAQRWLVDQRESLWSSAKQNNGFHHEYIRLLS